MSNPTVENVYTRQKAKELTKKHFWKLLGMMLVVLVITYAVVIGCTLLITAIAAGTMKPSSSAGTFNTVTTSPLTIVLSLLTIIITYLVTAGLGLGLLCVMINICRDNERIKFRQMFSRMGKCLKAFGLMLWVGLKTFLWALPGYAAIFAIGYALLGVTQNSTAAANDTTVALMTLLPFAGLILTLALVIPAGFRYMLSNYILADKPETGVFECVRQSKALMKGHKWQAFKLAVPPILLLYLFVLIIGIALGVVAAVVNDGDIAVVLSIITMVVTVVIALYYSLRLLLGYCIFYLKRQGEVPCIPPEEEERIVCWQPGQAPQPAGEPVASANDEHIAGWQPTENKPDQE